MAASYLMQFGPLQFEVQPLNFHELDEVTSAEWAKKEIAGAPVHREYVGEGDEEVHIRGKVFPDAIGGLSNLDVLETMRKMAHSDQLVRGDGTVKGWFVIEKLLRGHKHINSKGIGQQIDFEAVFVRVPVPQAETYFPNLYKLTG